MSTKNAYSDKEKRIFQDMDFDVERVERFGMSQVV